MPRRRVRQLILVLYVAALVGMAGMVTVSYTHLTLPTKA